MLPFRNDVAVEYDIAVQLWDTKYWLKLCVVEWVEWNKESRDRRMIV